jgi:hypothetical protein
MSVLLLFFGGVLIGVVISLAILHSERRFSIAKSNDVEPGQYKSPNDPSSSAPNLFKAIEANKSLLVGQLSPTLHYSPPAIDSSLSSPAVLSGSLQQSSAPVIPGSLVTKSQKKPKIPRLRWTPGDAIVVPSNEEANVNSAAAARK